MLNGKFKKAFNAYMQGDRKSCEAILNELQNKNIGRAYFCNALLHITNIAQDKFKVMNLVDQAIKLNYPLAYSLKAQLLELDSKDAMIEFVMQNYQYKDIIMRYYLCAIRSGYFGKTKYRDLEKGYYLSLETLKDFKKIIVSMQLPNREYKEYGKLFMEFLYEDSYCNLNYIIMLYLIQINNFNNRLWYRQIFYEAIKYCKDKELEVTIRCEYLNSVMNNKMELSEIGEASREAKALKNVVSQNNFILSRNILEQYIQTINSYENYFQKMKNRSVKYSSINFDRNEFLSQILPEVLGTALDKIDIHLSADRIYTINGKKYQPLKWYESGYLVDEKGNVSDIYVDSGGGVTIGSQYLGQIDSNGTLTENK